MAPPPIPDRCFLADLISSSTVVSYSDSSKSLWSLLARTLLAAIDFGLASRLLGVPLLELRTSSSSNSSGARCLRPCEGGWSLLGDFIDCGLFNLPVFPSSAATVGVNVSSSSVYVGECAVGCRKREGCWWVRVRRTAGEGAGSAAAGGVSSGSVSPPGCVTSFSRV